MSSKIPRLSANAGNDKPTTRFAPNTDTPRRRRPSATHHAYSGPDLPGAYPERQRGDSYTSNDAPKSPGFRSSGSMPSSESESAKPSVERDLLGSPINDCPGDRNPATVEEALAAVRPPGVGPLSPSPSSGSNRGWGHNPQHEDWCNYLESINPIAIAHQRARSGQQHSQSAEPGYGAGGERGGANSPSLDEPSFVSDISLDKGKKNDIASSMAPEQGHPFPKGSRNRGADEDLPSSGLRSVDIVEGAEGLASDIYRGAGHMFQQVEERAGKFMHREPVTEGPQLPSRPAELLHGAEHLMHQAEETAMSYMPHLPKSFGEKTNARSTLAGLGDQQPSPEPSKLPDTEGPDSSAQSFTVLSHYAGGGEEFDLDGEQIDTNQFIFEDDKTDTEVDQSEALIPKPDMTVSQTEKTPQPEPPTRNVVAEGRRRDRLSDAARHAYTPSDGTIPPTRGFGEGDVAVGHGGVSFYRNGIQSTADRPAILPGYPTPEGMAKLIDDRMKDDRARAREVGRERNNSTIVDTDASGRQVNVSPDSRVVQEMLDEKKHPRSSFFKGDKGSDIFMPLDTMLRAERPPSNLSSPDATTTGRRLEEVRQSPVFANGRDVAGGKFEAVFDDFQSEPVKAFSGVDPLYAPLRGRTIIAKSQTPVFRGGQSTATGRFDIPAFEEPHSLSMGKYEASYPEDAKTPTGEVRGQFAAPIVLPRNPQEKQEVPVFKGGNDTAAGRYEAGYMDVTGQPQEVPEKPEFIGQKGRDTASGKYESKFDPQLGELRTPESGTGTSAPPIKIQVPQEKPALPSRKPQERHTIPIYSGGSYADAIKEPPEHVEFIGRRGPQKSTGSVERREVPIFASGGDSAVGEYEAGFMDVTGKPQEVPEKPEFLGKQDSAAGKYEAKMEPKLTEIRAGEKGKAAEINKPVDYLGPPVSQVAEDEARSKKHLN